MRKTSNNPRKPFYKNLLKLASLLALLLTLTTCGGDVKVGENGSGTSSVKLMGYLSDENGNQINNATITFYSNPISTTTDTNGYWEASVGTGQHTLKIFESSGEQIYEGVITVTSTGIIDLLQKSGKNIRLYTVTANSNDDISGQGVCPTEIIVGNSSMTAGFSKEGRLTTLFHPSVGAFDQIVYRTKKATDISENEDFFGARPSDGSFAGIRINGTLYWLDSDDYWVRTIEYLNDGDYPVPITNFTYTGKDELSGLVITEEAFIPPDDNALLRRFTVAQNPPNRNISLLYYGHFNVSEHSHTSAWPFPVWQNGLNSVELTKDGIVWIDKGPNEYSLSIGIFGSFDGKSIAPMSRGDIDYIGDNFNNDGAYYTAKNPPSLLTEESLSMLGITDERINGFGEWSLGNNKEITIIVAGGRDNRDAKTVAVEALTKGVQSVRADTISTTKDWLCQSTKLSKESSADYLMWLMTLKMLFDKNTGAIIASPNYQPQYYGSWPRDGVYQSLALLLSNHKQEAEKFYNWLFDSKVLRDRNHWIQAYNSLTGENVGLPFEVGLEHDQMPTVLWGLWVFWKITGNIPSKVMEADIISVADYIVSHIDNNGLLEASLDWHEDPWLDKDKGQSLYTNSAAVAGLYAAAELIESFDSNKASTYREQANKIRKAVTDNLCNNDNCVTGIYGGSPTDRRPPEYNNYNLMAMAWPFNVFPYTDKKVENLYVKVKEDSGMMGGKLFVPLKLMTHLFEMEKGQQPIIEWADLKTDVGYVKDELEGASKPLGWAQAFGILSLLAEKGVRVPLINIGITYSISGTVKDSTGAGISGVNMTLSGSASSTVSTDSGGNYTFSGLANGSYTITPSKTGYSFSPTSTPVTVSGANITGQDFVGSASGSTNSLVGTWVMTIDHGEPVSPGDATMTFTETTWSFTSGSCTSSGTYTVSGNTLTTTWTASECEPAQVGGSGTGTYSISGNTLTLTMSDGTEVYERTSSSLITQSGIDLTGSWYGKLTQPSGGYSTEYPYTLTLTQQGTQINGTAKAESGSYYAIKSLSGSINGDIFSYTETGIMESSPPPGYSWCLVSVELKYTTGNPLSLSGTWTKAGCGSGSISVTKQ